MSSGTIYGTTGNQYIDSKIEWSSIPNIQTNKSTVTAKLYYKRNNTWLGATMGTGSFSITIDGTTSNASQYLTISATEWVLACTATKTVSHNADGTKTVLISATGSIGGASLSATSCSGRVTLDTIHSPSAITSASNITLGNSCKITFTPKTLAYNFEIKFSISGANWSGTTGKFFPGVTTAYTYEGYTVPMELAKYSTNSKSITITATLYTYSLSSASQIGSASTKTFECAIPENEETKPSVDMELVPDTPYSKFASLYLQGISKVKATFSAEGKLDATISSYSLSVQGNNYTSSDKTIQSNIITASGVVTVVGRATDSRGYYTDDPKEINVIAYEAPYIAPYSGYDYVICERCSKDGTPTDAGAYLHVKGKRIYTKINTDGIVNTCSIRCRYKPERGSWSHEKGGGVIVLSGENTTTDIIDVILPNIVSDTKKAYIVELSIADDTQNSATLLYSIASEEVEFELREGGRGAAFGKHSTTENLLECDWNAQFNGKLFVGESEITDVVIDSGVSGSWNYRLWLSGEAELWGRITLDTFGDARSIKAVVGLPFPFNAKPTVMMTLSEAVAYTYRQGQIILSEVYVVGASAITLYMIRNEGGLVSGNTADVSVTIKGKWK